jgi:two-component system NtrC family sensor kinase
MLRTLRFKTTSLVLLSLVICVGASYSYIITTQSQQFEKTTADQASVLTQTIVRSIQHDFQGTCIQDIQSIFERIGVLPDIESLRIYDEDGRVTKSGDPAEVGLSIEDFASEAIGYEVFKKGALSSPYRGGQGFNAFCMVVPIRNESSCRQCHESVSEVLGVFDLCISMKKTDLKVAENRRFLIYSALFTIAVVGLAITLLFTFQVNRPVGQIVRTMGEVERGDLSVRAHLPRRDELGAMGRSLNSMIEQLDSSRREIEAYHTDQLIRAERLASIGELAASVAHEIKNPLAGISGAVQVLAEDYPPDDPRREVAMQVLSQCDRMDATIRQLLDYAQPLKTELSAVDLNEVLEKSLFIAIPNPAKSPVRIHRRLRENLPRVIGDAKHFEQVFLNLLLNAIQSMPDGGDLTVKTSVREGEKPMIEVEVRDTGVGIPEGIRVKIFSPFYTTRTRGTGLGLPISRKILEQHGGRIAFRSEEGKGTAFLIDIPFGDGGA